MSDLQSYLEKALKEVQIPEIQQEEFVIDYDIEAEIREQIVVTRTSIGMTQKELANKSGVSQANISRIENGNYNPSIAVLKRIADGLGKRLIVEFADYEEEL